MKEDFLGKIFRFLGFNERVMKNSLFYFPLINLFFSLILSISFVLISKSLLSLIFHSSFFNNYICANQITNNIFLFISKALNFFNQILIKNNGENKINYYKNNIRYYIREIKKLVKCVFKFKRNCNDEIKIKNTIRTLN